MTTDLRCYGDDIQALADPVRRDHAADDLRVHGIRDVHHLEAGCTVRDIGVGARDRHPKGPFRRGDTADDRRTRGVRDVDHLQAD